MRRYEDPGDAIPHEMNVLVVSETETCFGRPFEAVVDGVRERLSCDKLLVQEYYHDLVDFSDRRLLVQHGIWLVHHSCLVDADAYPELHHYLTTGSYPDGTAIVVCVDPDVTETPDETAAELRTRYGDGVTVVTSHIGLVSYLSGFLDAVNPCSQAGLEYVMRWNNDVCDDLEIV